MEEKNIFEIHNYLNVKGSPEEIIEEIVKNIPELEGIGFAGYLEKDCLKKFLRGFILDKEGNNQSYSYEVKNEKEVRKICREIIKRCSNFIDKKIHIFLFPTFSKFVIEEMKGLNGFSSWDNTIWIFINFKDGWKESLRETIVHELAHAVSPFYKGGDFPIGYGLVLDGMAEHFKDFIVRGKKSPWTKAISEEKSWEVFKEIKDKGLLEVKDFDKYNEIFYGTGKYPNWTGYTVGYYLIKEYLKNQKEVNWNNFLRKNPKEILKEIEGL